MVANKDNLLADLELVKKVLCDTAKLDEEKNKFSKGIEDMANEFNFLVKMNTKLNKISRFGEKSMQNLKKNIKTRKMNIKI